MRFTSSLLLTYFLLPNLREICIFRKVNIFLKSLYGDYCEQHGPDNVPVFVRVTQQTEMELSLTQFHFTVLFQLHFPVIPPYLTSSVWC